MSLIILQDKQGREMQCHYEVESNSRPLGSGGMGQVLKGFLVNEKAGTKEEVAIKFLYDDLSQNVINRARKEASIQVHNENLIEMKGFIEIPEDVNGKKVMRYHVISEFLRGVRLLDLLNGNVNDYEGKEIPFAQDLLNRYQSERETVSIEIIKNILSGVMALHDFGYIHRDIDPSNVMITNGKIKLIDFGLAKRINTSRVSSDDQLTNAGQFMGKATYAAPELVSGDISHQNETTDLYAIGILLYRLVVGELPFTGSDAEVMNMQLHEKIPLKMIANKRLRRIIEKATEKRQSERYQSAAEFRVDLENLETAITSNDESQYEKNSIIKNVAIWGGTIIGGGLLGMIIRLLIGL